MTVIYPPEPIITIKEQKTLFLAGSIEMGKAIDWQNEVIKNLENKTITILNPRRKAWDSSWKQDMDNPLFAEQVNWELEGLEKADIIVVYFSPETQSPITLLEFGLYAQSGKLLVCCPEGFWRKGNIDVVCHRYGISQIYDLEELIEKLKSIV